MTGQYDPRMETLLRETMEHRWYATVYDRLGNVIPVNVVHAEITMDETWWPYCQGVVTIAVPDDQTTLDRLDPRQYVRCDLYAGYVLPDGTENVKLLARAWLNQRLTKRPSNEVELTIQGGEYVFGRVRCWTPISSIPDFSWSSTTQARDAVHSCLYTGAYRLPGGWTTASWDYDNARRDTGWAGDYYWDGSKYVDNTYSESSVDPGYIPLEVAQDVANRVDAWLFCDETGIWHLGDHPTVAGKSVHQLTVGSGGTVVTSDTMMERGDEWANAALVYVSWPDPSDRNHTMSYLGRAWVSGGPFSVTSVPIVSTFEERPVKAYMPSTTVDWVAGGILQRALTRGRNITLESVAAYWVRPAQTVTIQLPLGSQERHLVTAVTYKLNEGLMSITTRLPDNSSTLTIGG